MPLQNLILKKNEDRRLRAGHPWIFSNEIESRLSPLKQFSPGETVNVIAHDGSCAGTAWVNPHSLITARLFSQHKNTVPDKKFFTTRIQHALSLRKNIFSLPFYRLIFAESDSLPGVVCDQYDGQLVLQINSAGMEAHTSTLIDALRSVLPDTTGILLRNDSPVRQLEKLEQHVTPVFGKITDEVLLEENGVRFVAPLLNGQKTGWFYDHRLNRARLAPYVSGKKVLDVFSYLGAFGIQAAVSGAASVLCVDVSPLSENAIRQNAILNQVTEKVGILIGDAFDRLNELHAAGEKFDVIILDPPAFVKRQKDLGAGLAGYQRINAAALKLLATDGFLVSCSCSMQVSESEFATAIRKAGAKTKKQLQIVERGHQGPDHPVHPMIPETDYLKMVIVRAAEQTVPDTRHNSESA